MRRKTEDLVRPPFLTIMGLSDHEFLALKQFSDDGITGREERKTVTGWQLTFHFKSRNVAETLIAQIRKEIIQMRTGGVR